MYVKEEAGCVCVRVCVKETEREEQKGVYEKEEEKLSEISACTSDY